MSTGSNKNWEPPVRRLYDEPNWQDEADVQEKADKLKEDVLADFSLVFSDKLIAG